MTDTPSFDRDMAPIDYLLFRGEADPRNRTSMLALSILDRSPDFGRLRESFDRASRVVLRLRQHVVVPAVPVARPQWVVDPDFDLDYHVRRIRVPEPRTLRAALDFAATTLAAPLDTARPLWEAVLMEDLDDEAGEAALLMKLNHAVTDGVGAVRLFTQLFDFERDADRGPIPPLPVPADVSPTDLVRQAVTRAPATAITVAAGGLTGAVRRGLRAARNPTTTVRNARAMAGSVHRVIGPSAAAPSPLLRRRGLGRRFEVLELPLDTMRRAAKSVGCSVNDAYIAAIGGGLRRYHEALGAPVDTVRMALPVNLRSDHDPAGGNRFAGARIVAPVGEPDPVERMYEVREAVLNAIGEPAINTLGTAAPVLSRLPMPVLTRLSQIVSSTDVQASNLPGYPDTPYIAGSRIVKLYPFGPLPGVAVMVVLVSHAGTCFIGIHYDTASVSEPELFLRCMEEGFKEVLAVDPEAAADNGPAAASSAPAQPVETAESAMNTVEADSVVDVEGVVNSVNAAAPVAGEGMGR